MISPSPTAQETVIARPTPYPAYIHPILIRTRTDSPSSPHCESHYLEYRQHIRNRHPHRTCSAGRPRRENFRSILPTAIPSGLSSQRTGLWTSRQPIGPYCSSKLGTGGPVCPVTSSGMVRSCFSLRHVFDSSSSAGGQNTCVLVTVDRFSKACKFIPLRGLPTALETAEHLFHHVFRNVGVPEDIVSDRGPQFISHVWKAFFRPARSQGELVLWLSSPDERQAERKIQELRIPGMLPGRSVQLEPFPPMGRVCTKLPCKKLSPRYIGPFKIQRQINEATYQLQLPPRYRIHPTFHVSLLKHALLSLQINTSRTSLLLQRFWTSRQSTRSATSWTRGDRAGVFHRLGRAMDWKSNPGWPGTISLIPCYCRNSITPILTVPHLEAVVAPSPNEGIWSRPWRRV